MVIAAKICRGSVILPDGLNLPDGTEVELIIRGGKSAKPNAELASLPASGSEGLQPGVDLNDSRALRELLDASKQMSQLP